MTIQLLTGDVRDVLPTLADASVHTVVTSPPYWNLRDYGTALWDGGDAACDHLAAQAKPGNAAYTNGQGQAYASNLQSWAKRDASRVFTDTCGKCGARRIDRQLGLESSPEEYLAAMVAVFREVRRVLRPDGTCWVNLGDLFMNKQLQMMPARLAIALQADQWILRSDIIWAKPNPMPESCRDRCTSAHEHIFMLTKKPRYYFDADAIAEPAIRAGDVPGGTGGYISDITGGHNKDGLKANGMRPVAATRACRNVWTLSTESFSGAHFATFPRALAERCIRAGTSQYGCCAACGAPWVRVTEAGEITARGGKGARYHAARMDDSYAPGTEDDAMTARARITTGWRAGCQCDAGDPVPCTVLDCFSGAGTTLLVADRLQRHAIGIDLNASYADLARRRIEADAPLFTSWAPAEDQADQRMADLFAEAAE